ncbi:hypothetical protein HPG69_017915 [Diceros bicornis minor]|uniref:Ig-like domain-containing protein n=1 Tax=Diceros bicornis minor TaxID=77932 RepID=A0A7J7F3B2_DICBM|nr:hypothetical protein HPG69_017915 [Diceros bicornis minor]
MGVRDGAGRAKGCVSPQKLLPRTPSSSLSPHLPPPARQLRVLRPLEDVTVIEGGSATFQLELSQEGVTGEWARGGVRLQPGPKCRIRAEGHAHHLVLSGLGLADSGCIAFTADSLRCAARLTVREAPVTIVRGPQDLEVTEGNTATFECELSQALADVTWEKDGRPLTPSPRLRLQALGTRRLLQLRRCGPSDAGTYSCAVGTARAGPVRLTVLGGYGALPGPGTSLGTSLGTDSAGFQGEGRAVGVAGCAPPPPRPADAPAPPQSARCRCSPSCSRCAPAKATAPRSSAPCRRSTSAGAGS